MKPTPQPPQWARRFFYWFIDPDLLRFIEGDLLELYQEDVDVRNIRQANWRFTWEVLKLFRPSMMRPFKVFQLIYYSGMLRHNFLLSLRSFSRHRTSFLINLVGLTSGFVCALLILLWIRDEYRTDVYHSQDANLYQVMNNFAFGEEIQTWDYTPGPTAEAFEQEFPEVLTATTTNNHYFVPEGILTNEADINVPVSGLFGRSNYFTFFEYDFLKGNREQALSDPLAIVISKPLADKLFDPTEPILGQPLHWENRFFDTTFYVAGVFDPLPSQVRHQVEAVVNYQLLIDWDHYAGEWTGGYARTYVQLDERASEAGFEAKIADYMHDKHPTFTASTMFVQRFSDRYLYSEYENGVNTGGPITYVRLFALVALLIIVIACINFINLSTAQASYRMKEVGVKKTLGIPRGILAFRFMQESVMLTGIALAFALALVIMILPFFNQFTGKQIYLWQHFDLALPLLTFTVLIGIVAGLYPALYLTKFRPIAMLKGKALSGRGSAQRGEQWIRKGLVVVQFSLSIIFMVGMVVVQQQIQFSFERDMGYDREQIVSFHRPNGWRGHSDAFLDQVRQTPGVVSSSNMHYNLLDNIGMNSGFVWDEPNSEEIAFKTPRVGYDFLTTMGMEIVEGKEFTADNPNCHGTVLLSESAVKRMGYENPVGDQLVDVDGDTWEIIGVVKDFHYGSIHHTAEPLIFRFRKAGDNIIVKIQAGREQEVLASLQSSFEEFFPKYPFQYSFMEDDYQAQYARESNVGRLAQYFSALAVLISCLGLFGLAAFTARLRLKEVGIRKVMGAQISAIVALLGKEFLSPISIALVLAIPLSYLLMRDWLADYAYHIPLRWWYFAGVGVVMVMVALATVTTQTLRVARTNPVVCIRDE